MAHAVSDGADRLSSALLVDRVFAVLRAVAEAADGDDGAGGVSVTRVTAHTGLPKSTVSRILLSLERLRMVERAVAGPGYKIGRGLVALVARVPRTEQLATLAQPILQALHDAIGETVALTLPEGDNAYVAVQINSDHAIQVRDWTGVRIPMYAQSTGRVFLAARPQAALERYLSKQRAPYTAKTRVEADALRAALAEVRAQGHAWVIEEFEDGLSAVAAPVRDASGAVMAAVSMFGPSFRFPGARQRREVTRQVVEAAERLSQRLHAQSL